MRDARRGCLNVPRPLRRAPFEMNLMKRLPPLLLLSALILSAASCRSEGPAAAPDTNAAAPPPTPGAVEVSEETFRKELQQNPEDPAALYNLGTVLLASGKYADAAEQFKAVAAKEPTNVDALAKAGIAYASAGKLAEAADAFEGALRLQPKSAELHRRLAEVYEKAGRTAEAERERAEAGRAEPNARAKELYTSGKYLDALNELRAAPKRDAESFYFEGLALLKLKQPAEALAAFGQATRLEPKYADAHFQLGNVYDQLNRQEEAARAFGAAAPTPSTTSATPTRSWAGRRRPPTPSPRPSASVQATPRRASNSARPG